MSFLSIVYAVEEQVLLKPESGSTFANLGDLTIGGIVSGFIRLILVIASLVFFFVLVFGGITWIASGGDKAKTEEARNRITAALVGLVIVFSAWAIIQLIKVFFGVDIFELTLPSAVN